MNLADSPGKTALLTGSKSRQWKTSMRKWRSGWRPRMRGTS